MKTYQKIGLGSLGLIVSALALVLIWSPQKALAASQQDAQQCASTLHFTDIAHLQCSVVERDTAGQTKTVTFFDDNPTDTWNGNLNVRNDKWPIHYEPDGDFFCDPGDVHSHTDPVTSVTYTPGVSFTNSKLEDGIRFDSLNTNDGNRFKFKIVIGYSTTSVSNDCKMFGGGGGYNTSIPPGGATSNIKFLMQFADTDVVPLENVTESGTLGKYSFTQVSNYAPREPRRANVFSLAFADDDYSTCNGNILIAQTTGGEDSATAWTYKLKKDRGGVGNNSDPGSLFLKAAKVNSCTVDSGNGPFDGQTLGQPFSIKGTPPDTENDPNNVGKGLVGGNNKTCESNLNHPFSWIMCPALKLADMAAGYLNRFVEDQLCFKTDDTSSTGGQVCGGKNNLTPEVKVSWGIMKNIASALLVIIMLAMVIAQAFQSERIDAYTLRKLLPRLVAAVILIQLSWVLFKWLIDLSNDLGFGVRDLMFAPFGGEDNMHLDRIVGNGVQVATGGTLIGEQAFQFLVVLAGGGLALANVPGLMVMGIFIVFALLTAFFVLVLRKILILMLVILAPIALITWILPGTQNYWKLWRENFTRLLAMFPIIMSFIAAGRIFAWISSGGSGGTTAAWPHLAVAHLGGLPLPYLAASVTSFANLAIIVLAFFGPYFLLPKTFQWGGSIMSAAASGAFNMSDRLRKKTEEPVHGIGERWQGRRAKRYDPSDKNRFRRGYHRLASGHYLPTSRSRLLSIATGDKWAEERNQEMVALAARKREKATSKQGDIQAGKEQSINTLQTSLDPRRKKMFGIQPNDLHSRQAENAIKDLINTNSWFELENMDLQVPVIDKNGNATGEFKEGKVWETPQWRNALASNPELYGKVASSRPDWAPHRLRTGLPKYRGQYDEQELRQKRADEGYTPPQIDEEIRRLEASKGDAEVQNSLAFGDVIREMDVRQLNTIHPMIFKRLAEDANKGHKRLAQAQAARAAGNIPQADRLEEQAKIMLRPATEMRTMLETAVASGGALQVSNLMGGAETRDFVDRALSSVDHEVTPDQAPDIRLQDILVGRGNPQAQAQAAQQAAQAAQPGPGAVIPPGGVINIPHNTPTGRIISATDFEIQNDANTRPGGWGGFSNDELQDIYNHRTGDIKDRALQELRNRNLAAP